jgi:hypothetical protein
MTVGGEGFPWTAMLGSRPTPTTRRWIADIRIRVRMEGAEWKIVVYIRSVPYTKGGLIENCAIALSFVCPGLLT